MENWITEDELSQIRDMVLPDPMEDNRATLIVVLAENIELDEALSTAEPDDRPFPVREVQFSKAYTARGPKWALQGRLILER